MKVSVHRPADSPTDYRIIVSGNFARFLSIEVSSKPFLQCFVFYFFLTQALNDITRSTCDNAQQIFLFSLCFIPIL